MNLEKSFLAWCLRSEKTLDLITLKRFQLSYLVVPDHQKLFELLEWVHKKYHCLLTEPILKQILAKSVNKTDEEQKRLILLFHELSTLPNPEAPDTFFVDQLIDLFLKRSLEENIKSAAVLLRDKKPEDALFFLKSKLAKLSTATSDDQLEEGYLGDATKEIYQEYTDKKNHPESFGGIKTGFPRLDAETNGLQKGQVIVLLGKEKSAKSIGLLNIAHNVANQKKRVLLIVNEGGKQLVQRRYAALDAGIGYSKLRDGALSPEDETKLTQSLAKLENSKYLFISSIPPVLCTTSMINSKLEELEITGQFDLIIIDFLGLMDSDNPSVRKEDDWKKLGSITLELKSLAMLKRIPILTVMHVNREAAKRGGESFRTSDVSRSFEIGKYIDALISWKVVNEEEFRILHMGDIILEIAAARDSAPVRVELFADLNKMSIVEKSILGVSSPTVSAPVGGSNDVVSTQ